LWRNLHNICFNMYYPFFQPLRLDTSAKFA
jgi:hypothetical protein